MEGPLEKADSGLNLASKPPRGAQQGEHRTCVVTFSAMLYRTSSIFMQVGSQSCPKRMTTTRSSSERMAWSTCQPLCRCGSMYDILSAPARPDAASYLRAQREPRSRPHPDRTNPACTPDSLPRAPLQTRRPPHPKPPLPAPAPKPIQGLGSHRNHTPNLHLRRGQTPAAPAPRGPQQTTSNLV